MTPAQLSAIRSILGPMFSEARARELVEALRPSIRNETLEEVACWQENVGWKLDEELDVPPAIRAMKS